MPLSCDLKQPFWCTRGGYILMIKVCRCCCCCLCTHVPVPVIVFVCPCMPSLYESLVVNEYVNDLEGPDLLPQDPAARARARLMIDQVGGPVWLSCRCQGAVGARGWVGCQHMHMGVAQPPSYCLVTAGNNPVACCSCLLHAPGLLPCPTTNPYLCSADIIHDAQQCVEHQLTSTTPSPTQTCLYHCPAVLPHRSLAPRLVVHLAR